MLSMYCCYCVRHNCLLQSVMKLISASAYNHSHRCNSHGLHQLPPLERHIFLASVKWISHQPLACDYSINKSPRSMHISLIEKLVSHDHPVSALLVNTVRVCSYWIDNNISRTSRSGGSSSNRASTK